MPEIVAAGVAGAGNVSRSQKLCDSAVRRCNAVAESSVNTKREGGGSVKDDDGRLRRTSADWRRRAVA